MAGGGVAVARGPMLRPPEQTRFSKISGKQMCAVCELAGEGLVGGVGWQAKVLVKGRRW